MKKKTMRSVATPVGKLWLVENEPPQWICAKCSVINSNFDSMCCSSCYSSNPFRGTKHIPETTDARGNQLVAGALYATYNGRGTVIVRYIDEVTDHRNIHCIRLEVVWELRKHSTKYGHDSSIGNMRCRERWTECIRLEPFDPLWFGLVYNDLVKAVGQEFGDANPRIETVQ